MKDARHGGSVSDKAAADVRQGLFTKNRSPEGSGGGATGRRGGGGGDGGSGRGEDDDQTILPTSPSAPPLPLNYNLPPRVASLRPRSASGNAEGSFLAADNQPCAWRWDSGRSAQRWA